MFHLKPKTASDDYNIENTGKKSIKIKGKGSIDGGFLVRIRKSIVEMDGAERIIVMIKDCSDSYKFEKV